METKETTENDLVRLQSFIEKIFKQLNLNYVDYRSMIVVDGGVGGNNVSLV